MSRRELRFTPEQEAHRRELNKLSWQVLLTHLPIVGVAFFIDSLAGCAATFITLANVVMLSFHVQHCRQKGVVWWKKLPAVAFLINVFTIIFFSTVSYTIHIMRQTVTFEHAILETYVSSKLAASCDEASCPSVSVHEGMDWMYIYETRVNGKTCKIIIVRDVWHDCPSGFKNVPKRE
jgi:hypothetical protein